VCVVGLVSLRNIASVSRSAVTRQIAALDESRAFARLAALPGDWLGADDGIVPWACIDCNKPSQRLPYSSRRTA
jgi:hypothetical protein